MGGVALAYDRAGSGTPVLVLHGWPGDRDDFAVVTELLMGQAADVVCPDLRGGVSTNLTNQSGDSLVMLAAYHGHAETVAALVERGADPNQVNDKGQTPLAGAVFKSETAVVEALIAGGADAKAGQPSALQAAVMFGRDDLIELLRPH